MNFIKIIFYVLSPTYLYADYKKKKMNEREKALFILKKNKSYFIFSTIVFIIITIMDLLCKIDFNNYQYPIMLILFYHCFSRVNEIFIAFLSDVNEKLNNEFKLTFITYKLRMRLALFSYFELILNYTLIYWIIYKTFGFFNHIQLNILNLLYFSGITITTLGYGDIHPIHFIPQIISIYEVFNGMLIVIVCFTIYVSLNYKKDIINKIKSYKLDYIPDIEYIKSKYQTFKKENINNLIISLFFIIVIIIGGFILLNRIFPTNFYFSFFLYLFNIILLTLINKK